jgi:small subunit ribosomal protein S18
MSTPTKPRYGPGRPGGGAGGGPRRRYVRKKFCRFCAEKDLRIDYKNVYMLKHFVSERGKIVPRRTAQTDGGDQKGPHRGVDSVYGNAGQVGGDR